jgi:hypothetical protein
VHKYHIFLMHSSVMGHLGCFHDWGIVNSAAINMGVQIPRKHFICQNVPSFSCSVMGFTLWYPCNRYNCVDVFCFTMACVRVDKDLLSSGSKHGIIRQPNPLSHSNVNSGTCISNCWDASSGGSPLACLSICTLQTLT